MTTDTIAHINFWLIFLGGFLSASALGVIIFSYFKRYHDNQMYALRIAAESQNKTEQEKYNNLFQRLVDNEFQRRRLVVFCETIKSNLEEMLNIQHEYYHSAKVKEFNNQQ